MEDKPDIGTAIEGTAAPKQQIPEHIRKHELFEPLKRWLEQPENFATAAVLATSLALPRDKGLNPFQTVMQRGLGTLAFRSNLQEQMAQGEREQQKQDADIQHKKEQIAVGREQIAATDRNTAADLEAAKAATAAQQQMSSEGNRSREQIAALGARTDLAVAEMAAAARAAQSQGDPFPWQIFSVVEEMRQNARMNGEPFDAQAVLQSMLRMWIGSDPARAGMFHIFDQESAPAAAPVPAAPAPAPQRRVEGPASPGYTRVPQNAPAVGLPDHRLGQSYGDMSKHEQPPKRNKDLYPGTK